MMTEYCAKANKEKEDLPKVLNWKSQCLVFLLHFLISKREEKHATPGVKEDVSKNKGASFWFGKIKIFLVLKLFLLFTF